MTEKDELIWLRAAYQAQQEQLAQRDGVIAEQQEHMTLLKQQVTALAQQVQALQEQLAKDSHNSHLPPSSDRFVRQPRSQRQKSGKKAGGQPGHMGKTLMWSDCPDEVIVHAVSCCEHCQADLQAVPPLQIERRQVVDVPLPHLLVQEHQAERKLCPHCQQISAAPFPSQVTAPIQYGTRLAALAVYLVQQQLLSWSRACEVLADVLGVQMSEGTLASLIERCSGQLAPVEEQIKQALIQASLLHQDETGLDVKGSRYWMHVACSDQLTHYALHRKRGKEALDAIGILPHFQGTSVHDGWQSYFRYACSHALCLVHLLRELTFLAEEQQQGWADELKSLLFSMKEAAEQARQAGQSSLHEVEVQDWEQEYWRLVEVGEQLNPVAQAPPGKKGRRKQSPARNLLDRLRRDEQAVLAFLHRLIVPFDNNQAERDLRMVKVQQKVSGSFRSEEGACAFCRIRGYLSTLRKQGLPLLAALEATLRGHPILPSF